MLYEVITDLLYKWENDIEIWEVSNTKTPYSKHVLAQYLVESAKDIYARNNFV